MQPNSLRIVGGKQQASAQAKASKASNLHRVVSPQFRAIIAEECRQRGSVETAHQWGITVSAALECRIEALDKLLAQTRDMLLRMDRAA